MTSIRLSPSSLKETSIISSIPGDKSISHRAIILGALSTNASTFNNFLFSEDCLCTSRIFKQLGVSITESPNTLSVAIKGVGLNGLTQSKTDLDVGNSGTAIRLINGILAAQSFSSTITGDHSIQRRPMKRIIDPLAEMGANISGQELDQKTDIFPPLRITPIQKISPITYTLPVASAQVKSAIILASLYCKTPTTIIEPEKCRDHTENFLNFFGADIKVEGTTITCSGKYPLKNPSNSPITIPSDFSSAAFFIALGLISKNCHIKLTNIGLNPTRAALLDHLKKMNAAIQIESHSNGIEALGDITVSSSPLTNQSVDRAIIPFVIDEFPILAIVGLFSKGKFTIEDVPELRVKESDRIKSTVSMIQKMGCKITELENGFTFDGNQKIQPFEVDSFGDHRIAMSAIIAAMASGVEATIHNVDCIQTSFPNFFKILDSLNQVYTKC